MIYNRTYFNKKDEKEINETLGNSFSFLQILKLRGVGSSRFIIHSCFNLYQNRMRRGGNCFGDRNGNRSNK